jgi:hypothetical protein
MRKDSLGEWIDLTGHFPGAVAVASIGKLARVGSGLWSPNQLGSQKQRQLEGRGYPYAIFRAVAADPRRLRLGFAE